MLNAYIFRTFKGAKVYKNVWHLLKTKATHPSNNLGYLSDFTLLYIRRYNFLSQNANGCLKKNFKNKNRKISKIHFLCRIMMVCSVIKSKKDNCIFKI